MSFFATLLGGKILSQSADKEFVEKGDRDLGFAKFYNEKIRSSARQFEKIRLDHLRNFRIACGLSILALVPGVGNQYLVAVWAVIALVFILSSARQFKKILLDNLRSFPTSCRLLILVLIAVAGSFCVLDSQQREQFMKIQAAFWVGIALIVLPMLGAYWIRYDFKLKVKSGLFKSVVTFFDGFDFIPNGVGEIISGWGLQRFDILPQYLHLASEDLISGRYKDVELSFAEIRAHDYVKNILGKRSPKEVYRGAIIMFTFNKPFKGRTLVKKDKGLIGNFTQAWLKKDKSIIGKFAQEVSDVRMSRVELEDPEFEKIFQVYGSDQVESRYLLTTSFMERLKKLTQFFGGDQVEASFHEGNLLLAFRNSKNLFEPTSLFQQIDVVGECRKVIQQMGLIFDVVDVLKLNEKTGL